jgi:hypothetical protein
LHVAGQSHVRLIQSIAKKVLVIAALGWANDLAGVECFILAEDDY